MSCGDLRAVGVIVDRCKRVHETPNARTQKRQYRRTHCPQHRRFVGVFALTFIDHIEGKQRHNEERNRFKCRENRPPPLPVSRRTNPVKVMPCTDNAGNQRHRNDYIQPFFNHFAVNTGDFNQHEGEDGGQNQFPHAFHPQMHHKPPVVFVLHQIVRIVEREQEEHCQP